MTTIPSITPLPTPPQTSDPADFDERADAFLAALPTMVTQENAAIAAINTVAGEVSANASGAAGSASAAAASAATAGVAATASVASAGYMVDSASSFSIGTGSKAFAVLSGKNFAASDQVVVLRKGDSAARMYGTVSSYVGTTLTLNITSYLGSGGPFTDWIIAEKVFEPLAASTTAQVLGGSNASTAITPAALATASAFLTLTDASTIAWDTTQGLNARVTLAASGHTIGAPTNLIDGWTYSLEIIQDATGSRTVSWNAIWDFGAAGLPVLQTGASKADRVFGQYNARTGKIESSFRRGA